MTWGIGCACPTAPNCYHYPPKPETPLTDVIRELRACLVIAMSDYHQTPTELTRIRAALAVTKDYE